METGEGMEMTAVEKTYAPVETDCNR